MNVERTLRILVVEDNRADVELMELALRQAEIEVAVRHVERRPEYLAALTEGGWDVVLCDYSLPHLDGLSAFAILREHDPLTPFIIVSGKLGEATAVEAMRMGISDYVLKSQLNRLPGAVLREVRELQSRRSRQEALERSEAQLNAVVQQLPGLVLTIDTDLRILFARGAGLEDLKLKQEQLVGVDLRQVLTDGGDPSAAEAFERALAGQAGQHEIKHAGRVLQLHTTPLRDTTGIITGAIGVALDVTEIRRVENELRVSQRLEAIGRLAAGVAHDFNNNLTVITSLAHMIQVNSEEADPSHEDATGILDSAESAASLTRQLLEFSSQQFLKLQAVDLSFVVRHLLRMVRRLLGENITLKADLPNHPATVRSDPVQIEQVLMNLVVNAQDAMPEGGRLFISVEFESPEQAGELSEGSGDPPFIRLVVRDTGIGMDEEVRSRVFEPFFTTKGADGRGTGLGLSSAYGIVTQCGGSIDVHSSPGEGSTFTIRLPRIVGEQTQGQNQAAAAPRESRVSATVLVVDDERSVLRVVARSLEVAGYNVLAASCPETALSLAADHRGDIELLLVDIVMPGMNGFELAQRMREQREVRVLFMSGWRGKEGVDDVPGSDDFIAKPFSPKALMSAVRSSLERELPSGPGAAAHSC